ncbi:MAG TPA: S41 family peptidase [Planctomycetaceae bacterium]|jgi:carboxyl-terminal processing protease|nr:S41 family peptidase [Planctomycetaceae bacterium]
MIFASRSCTRVFQAVLLFVIFAFVIPSQELRAGRATGVDQTPADVADAIELGLKKERTRRWLDAIDTYEHALKHFPDNGEIKYGLRRSKIQFAVERRYEDNSFDSRLLQLPRESALSLFDRVLEYVRQNYVDEVSATSFVAHGTESLYHALANEKFIAHNLSQVDPERVAHLRRTLRERFWNRPVEDYSVAHDTVSEVCNLAGSEVNLPPTTVIFEYIFGGCNCLDDYSNFLTPDRLTDLHGNINGEFVGLGIEMKGEPGKGMFLVNVLPDSPAEQGGLHAGEYIVGINGASCVNMTTDEAARILRGPPGTRVTLAIQTSPGDNSRQGEFVRRAVEVKSIPVAQIVDRQRGIAYIRMTAFQATSPRELDAALSRLSREGMRSVIWDLRGNPGGLLSAATSVLDRFIDSGVLVSTRGRSLDGNSSFSASPHAKYHIPMVVLVDENSASASEIVAGAVHDHKRATLVGRTTFGKWCVQSIFYMPNGAGLRLTTAKFFSPQGHNFSEIGVRPDVSVTADDDQYIALKPPVDGQSAVAPRGDGPTASASVRHKAMRIRPSLREVPGPEDQDMRKALEVLTHPAQLTGR